MRASSRSPLILLKDVILSEAKYLLLNGIIARRPAFGRAAKDLLFGLVVALALTTAASAADLTLPTNAVAGNAVSIATSGSGDATFYLVGPVTRLKRKVRLGEPVNLSPKEVREAGRYIAILRGGDGETAKAFFVSSAEPANISFLAQPSRVPAATPGVITGTAFLFDRYDNLVLVPQPVKFELSLGDGTPVIRNVTSRDGIAWTRLDSSRHAGAAQFVASSGEASVRRVVQQVAADPCHLRMRAERKANGILVETDPVRDCSGNPVPDGTIVTFTDVDSRGKSTVDARIKKGIAQAEFPAAGSASISVASGVVMGNEIRVGGER